MFHQQLDPLHSIVGVTLLALVPVVTLLALMAGLRLSAWKVVIIGSVVTLVIAVAAWSAPLGGSLSAYGLGAGTGFWAIDWIVFWGVVIYNTLVFTGAFEDFKQWLISQATADVRVQAILMAWSFGALLEGLVGFGYPWAVVAPILITLGVADLPALRVAAIANNAPVSFGALGAPLIGLAAVTGLPLLELSASVAKIVAILALAPPWILLYLVAGRKGIRGGWPLAVVGSLAYIAGQFPMAEWVGPYLPDITGSIVSFLALLLLLRFWRPAQVLGYGGRVLTEAELARTPSTVGAVGDPRGQVTVPHPPAVTRAPVLRAIIPFLILIAVVVAWTGPWSPLPKYLAFKPTVVFVASLSHKLDKIAWEFAPAIAGTAMLASWVLICLFLRPRPGELRQAFAASFRQMWGALLVGPFIFGLADVFNYSGMASSMAYGFSKVGTVFIVLAPLLGWIGVALSGSNTATNAVFGAFQLSVARLLGAPALLFPSLNSVGAEVGKPVAPQTASVGVATSRFVRDEGAVIRYNMPWTLAILAYLVAIGCLFYFLLPGAMRL
jgi:lactate permease